MRRVLPGLLSLLLAVTVALAPPLDGWAASNDRWLHVGVEKAGEEGESVRVNVPLAVAEKVLPAIHTRELEGGKLRIRHAQIHNVHLPALLAAIRTLDDGEFLTVESKDKNVRVAKEGGYLLVKVDERREKAERVDIKIPFSVVEALLSGEEGELNLLAAVQALNAHGDEALITVESDDETVRVWVDSKNTMD